MTNNLHDDQEALETLSLTDFPLALDPDASTLNDNGNTSSSSLSSSSLSSSDSNDLFEFFRGELSEKMMSHAEDIIFCGKLLAPINQQSEKHHLWSRSESRSDVKTTTVGPLVKTSRSLVYKKLKRSSSMSSDISRDGSGKKSSSSLRRHAVSYGLMHVRPQEMNIRDLKSRQLRMNKVTTSIASSESVDDPPVSRSVRHRKISWKVLELLSCKSSSAAVMTPLGYMAKV
ncbi:uncharacterized protein LOC143557546 [Bidens hawaiensis]|uniref:uncharacterized protein LOC143557546 n=1 Tax=Bidens hawaiensis TaxID=980011 RepID=UPI00404A783A